MLRNELLERFDIVLERKAGFGGVVGLLMFDFKLDFIDYVIVFSRVNWIVIMEWMIVIAP